MCPFNSCRIKDTFLIILISLLLTFLPHCISLSLSFNLSLSFSFTMTIKIDALGTVFFLFISSWKYFKIQFNRLSNLKRKRKKPYKIRKTSKTDVKSRWMSCAQHWKNTRFIVFICCLQIFPFFSYSGYIYLVLKIILNALFKLIATHLQGYKQWHVTDYSHLEGNTSTFKGTWKRSKLHVEKNHWRGIKVK